jgi:uncharacterized membrane protein SpoIIM required for sporulation
MTEGAHVMAIGTTAMNRLRNHWTIALATFCLAAGLTAGVVCAPSVAHLTSPHAIAPNGLIDVWVIFGHNARVAARLLVGILTFGVQASVGLGWIGYDLGKLMAIAAQTVSGATIVVTVVPHAVAELLAFILFGSLQFEMVRIAIRLFHGPALPTGADLLPLARRALTAVALLACAAFIEVFVSGQLGARLT